MKLKKMLFISTLLLTGIVCAIAQAASLSRSDIPAGSNWYVHVNLDLIQNSEVGRKLMLATVDEALDDIQEELNVDIRKEIQGVTVFGAKLPVDGNPEKEAAVILHGNVSAETREALLSSMESIAELTRKNSKMDMWKTSHGVITRRCISHLDRYRHWSPKARG